jgi:citrate synthase
MSHKHLLAAENRLVTALGKAFLCERVVMRGRDLHHDLGEKDWFSLYLFSITGREFTEPQLKMLNFLWVATSYPEPSIWPNHVAALAGSVRSTASLALMAGLSISEASIYGRRPERRALDFFYRLGVAVEDGVALEAFVELELKRHKIIYGYGRPLARTDERIPHTLKRAEALGFAEGRHLKLALAVYRYLHGSKGLSMNIAAIYSALMADLGFSPEENQLFMSPSFVAGMVPCYIDARDRPEGSFFPVRCDSLLYDGCPQRPWD